MKINQALKTTKASKQINTRQALEKLQSFFLFTSVPGTFSEALGEKDSESVPGTEQEPKRNKGFESVPGTD
ncbi:hypothetical protein [Bacillus sp. Marseille-Q3570]|uniref:hypothetical protein n=1 Tax=Bacillus sp. Marseille-Q3570 TaxID=2963522 RepID=UPI0021B80C71|nr:hypothetical protein [Bacillus sp. Marseille-Q3570]